MTVRLTVKQRSEQGGAEKPSVVLLEDDTITLGRDTNCQVVLAQQAVSRTHARITRDGSLFFVEDLGSSFGTRINGKKLPKGEKQLLRNGDVIVIAQFDVTFDRVAEGQSEGDGGASTQFVAKKVVRDVMRGLAAGGEQPYLRVMNGPKEGQRIEVSDAQEYVIGRDEDVAIVLKDDLVSRRHAKIRRDWSGTHVEDLGSRNGIKVNRKRVKKKTLKDRDELEVGGIRLLFIDPTEVREAPVVLPDEEEATTATPADEPLKPDPSVEAPDPAPEAAPEPAAEAPVEPEPPAEEPEPQAEPPPEEEPADEEAPQGGGLDLSNRTTLVFLAIAAFTVLAGVILLVLLLAGA